MTTAADPRASAAPGAGWALVTGSSSGLGREFARVLAGRGHDLILVARRAERLDELRRELTARYPIRVEVAAIDLAGDDGLAACRRLLEGRPLEVAVLNAGFGSLGPFASADRDHEDRMVRLNCLAVVDLARAIVPGMRARGRGRIIVTSSAAAFHPVPYMATYGATKAFALHFVRALAEELRGTGVGVLAVCPGPTRTEFSQGLGPGGSGGSGWPAAMPLDDPRDVVVAAMHAADRGRTVVATGRVAAWTRVAVRIVPTDWSLRLVGAVHRRRHRTRARAGKRGGA